jgi:Family of unknown function (DUF5695)
MSSLNGIAARRAINRIGVAKSVSICVHPWFSTYILSLSFVKTLSLILLAAVLFSTQLARGASLFDVTFSNGAIASLKRVHDPDPAATDYARQRLGDLVIRYRQSSNQWQTVQTATLAENGAGIFTTNAEGNVSKAIYTITNNGTATLRVQVNFEVREQDVLWWFNLQNETDKPMEIGDLAIPMTVGVAPPAPRGGRGGAGARGNNGPTILKQSFVSGSDSYMFWQRSDLIGPYLMLTTDDETKLEYWEAGGRGGGAGGGGYQVFIHSEVAGNIAKQGGTKWRQPNTSLTLAPKDQTGDNKSYGFKLQWADDYDAVRKNLVDGGKVDVHVVPGMTVPTDLFAEFALNTKHKITSVEAEFPAATTIKSLGSKGPNQLYSVKFSKLGENRLAVHYEPNQTMYLEFFSTEPVETLISKRANFIAHSQHTDTNKWYNGLISDRNMLTDALLGPDNYDLLRGFRVYEVSCDDPGLCKPAFLAAKNADYPVQSEVAAMDYYLQHFVWGGLQRTTNETYSYGIYGILDWKQNRESTNTGEGGQLHIWREYDYPHVLVMYEAMYRVAKYHPEIHTELTADEYLERAYGTANAMVVVPRQVDGGGYNGTGFYNELVFLDIIQELEDNGKQEQASRLRNDWEQKVRYFVNRGANLFQSEYAFDTTGFESTEALAKYAMLHSDAQADYKMTNVTPDHARAFLDKQMNANIFCRGWLTPTYYLLGSDIRGGGGNSYTLTYMSQMGGWGVLDYGLNFAAKPVDYLRLGYASMLSSWALMNTGTPESSYGYWFPGKEKDGGAGGGFEPAPFGQTWLGQAHHRGSWMYASEIDLGYCGALRGAATVLADDPIFGRFCYGGEWRKKFLGGLEIIPHDGVRRRFDAVLDNGKLSLILDNDHFAAGKPIALKGNLSEAGFSLETGNPQAHTATLHLSASASGSYEIRSGKTAITTVNLNGGREMLVRLPVDGRSLAFTVAKK